MSEGYIGEIRSFGFNFAPINWMQCNGQLLSISSYTALFSIIGTYYGGNGTTNFGLPNLQGQIPMHWGTTAGLPTTTIGEIQGQTSVSLTIAQIPIHMHTAYAAAQTSESERTPSPNTNSTSFLAGSKPGSIYRAAAAISPQFATNAISLTGSSIPHDNMQPYQVLNFCICYNGVFPSRG